MATTAQRLKAQKKALSAQLADMLEAESRGLIADAVARADLESKIWTIRAEIEREPRDAKDAAMVAARFAETAARLGRAAAYDRIGELEAELERMKQTQVKLRAI